MPIGQEGALRFTVRKEHVEPSLLYLWSTLRFFPASSLLWLGRAELHSTILPPCHRGAFWSPVSLKTEKLLSAAPQPTSSLCSPGLSLNRAGTGSSDVSHLMIPSFPWKSRILSCSGQSRCIQIGKGAQLTIMFIVSMSSCRIWFLKVYVLKTDPPRDFLPSFSQLICWLDVYQVLSPLGNVKIHVAKCVPIISTMNTYGPSSWGECRSFWCSFQEPRRSSEPFEVCTHMAITHSTHWRKV